jgi:predicted NBD/HSP70 family sugar kinase
MKHTVQYETLYSLTENERRLLDLIWRRESIARKSLADATGLTGASATRLTKRIMELGLVEESIEKDGKRGSPNRPLRKNKNYYFSIGLSFNKSSVTLVLVCAEGKIIEKETIETETINVDFFSNVLSTFIKQSDTLSAKKTKLLGIGVAVPGYRSICDQQWAIHWDYAALLDTSIEDELYKRLKVPVIVERDAVAALWAERLQGIGRKIDDLFVMYLGQGVGGCAMLNGKPIAGSRGNAGGLGILFPYDKPRPSAKGYRDFMPSKDMGLNDGKHNGIENKINSWIEQVLPGLKHGIDTISRLYDPSHLIIAGELPPLVIEKLVERLDYQNIKTGYTAEIGVPKVEASCFSESITLIGASVLPISALITGSFKSRLKQFT